MTTKEFLHILDHHKKAVIQIAAIAICFFVLLGFAKFASRKADPLYGARESYQISTNNSELNDLISRYYENYYSDNIDALSEFVSPIGDREKSYIQFISDYVDGCDIVEIYSKPGATNDSYLVSVYANLKFKDISEAVPGLDFFYVYRNLDGRLKIDNAYSFSVGGKDPDIEKDEQIVALIEEFDAQEDVVILKHDIASKYYSHIENNEELRVFVTDTLTNAVNQWVMDYNAMLAATEAEEQAALLAAQEAEAKAAAEAEAAAAAEAEAKAKAEADAAAAAAAAEAAQHVAPGGYPAGTEVTVSDILNIRQEPSTEATKVGTVMRGGVVKVLENSADNGWTKIDHNGKVGYIRTDVLR